MGKDDKKGGAEKKPNKHKLYERYEVSGDAVKRKNQSCPKCGPGYLLAAHKDRSYCGKCHYMEKQ